MIERKVRKMSDPLQDGGAPGEWHAPRKSLVVIDDVQTKRIAELEARLAEIFSSARRMSFENEWYLEGLRNPPGDYVLMRVGPVTSDETPF